jgi:hypothetical protein
MMTARNLLSSAQHLCPGYARMDTAARALGVLSSRMDEGAGFDMFGRLPL